MYTPLRQILIGEMSKIQLPTQTIIGERRAGVPSGWKEPRLERIGLEIEDVRGDKAVVYSLDDGVVKFFVDLSVTHYVNLETVSHQSANVLFCQCRRRQQNQLGGSICQSHACYRNQPRDSGNNLRPSLSPIDPLSRGVISARKCPIRVKKRHHVDVSATSESGRCLRVYKYTRASDVRCGTPDG
jgi:hypothetical protein